MSATPFLWLYGPPGAGKTTIAWELHRQLCEEGVRSAYVDADQLGLCYPAPDDDPGNDRAKAAGLGAVWSGHRAEGAECLILSGSVDSAQQVREYTAQVPDTAPTLCLLTAGPEALKTRLVRRGSPEFIEGALREAELLELEPLGDMRIDTTGRAVEEITAELRARLGPWPVSPDRAPALWVCGPEGVGKSTVAFQVYMHLLSTGAKAAYVDLAQIGHAAPAADPHALKAENLRALWRTHRAAGSSYLVVSGATGEQETTGRYLRSLSDCDLFLCRLTAAPDKLAARIRGRGRGEGVELPGDELRGLPAADLERRAEAAIAEAATLDRDRIGDLAIDTSALAPDRTAETILRHWPPRR